MEPEKFIGQMTKLINVILPRNSKVEDQEVHSHVLLLLLLLRLVGSGAAHCEYFP